MDLLANNVETILTNKEWAFVELLRHPETMKKARQELDDDLPNLSYLESMRLHTPLPILIPRMAVDDFTLQGFHVPRGSQVIVNASAIGRDAATWPKPERFWPERFDRLNVDFKDMILSSFRSELGGGFVQGLEDAGGGEGRNGFSDTMLDFCVELPTSVVCGDPFQGICAPKFITDRPYCRMLLAIEFYFCANWRCSSDQFCFHDLLLLCLSF